MTTLRTLIVDDEPLARVRLRDAMTDEPGFEIVGECGDGPSAVRAILEQSPDLVLLDVQMPGLDGFGVIDEVGVERMPEVVFVTAYDDYALRAFDVHALDYVLKPFEHARLSEALQRVRQRCELRAEGNLAQQLSLLLSQRAAPERAPERLVVQAGGRIVFVGVDEIDWVESAGNYQKLVVGRETYMVRETMKSLAARLDPSRFLRIHRSTLVQRDRIRELIPGDDDEYLVLLKDGRRLKSSHQYRQALRRLGEES